MVFEKENTDFPSRLSIVISLQISKILFVTTKLKSYGGSRGEEF